MKQRYIKEYIPASWFHPKGIYKVLKRFWHRLPNVSDCLFVTLTIDREAMKTQGLGPSEAFDKSRDRVRRVFNKLKKGVIWEGKRFKIPKPFCTKVEFHMDEEGWPHFHVISLSKRFVPTELLEALWGYGFVNVRRIQNEDFHYLLKYVCKAGDVPEWVQDRKRIRIFQPSRGFLLPEETKKEPSPPRKKKPRKFCTIRERLKKWQRMAIHISEDLDTGEKKYSEMFLRGSFRKLLETLVLDIAREGRYLGEGVVKITSVHQLDPWIDPDANMVLRC